MPSQRPSHLPVDDADDDDAVVAAHAITRNALRVTLSAKEYKFLHERLLKQISTLNNHLPSPAGYESIVRTSNKHNVAAIRASLRVFLAVSGGMSLVEAVAARIGKTSSERFVQTLLLFSLRDSI